MQPCVSKTTAISCGDERRDVVERNKVGRGIVSYLKTKDDIVGQQLTPVLALTDERLVRKIVMKMYSKRYQRAMNFFIRQGWAHRDRIGILTIVNRGALEAYLANHRVDVQQVDHTVFNGVNSYQNDAGLEMSPASAGYYYLNNPTNDPNGNLNALQHTAEAFSPRYQLQSNRAKIPLPSVVRIMKKTNGQHM